MSLGFSNGKNTYLPLSGFIALLRLFCKTWFLFRSKKLQIIQLTWTLIFMDSYLNFVSCCDATWPNHIDSWWTNVYFPYIVINCYILAATARTYKIKKKLMTIA